VSTDEQATTGHSLEAQEAACRAYCALRGFTVSAVVVDAGVSGGTPLASRPGGAQALTELAKRNGPRHVVCVKLDRAFRSAADCLQVTGEWDRRGVSLHLTDLGGQAVDTSSAMGRFMLTVLAGAAELEKNLIGERTSSAMQSMKAQGLYTGGRVRYGYAVAADGVTLTECPTEQATIAEARALSARGLSQRAIAAELAERGMLTRNGRMFDQKAIPTLLAA
jgi:DNA invertase Pin-like site-specific DNA recombinase